MKKILSALILFWISKTNVFGAEAGMPQLDPKYWFSQAFWLIIVFSSIYLLISKIFIPKIKSNIDTRKDKIRKDLEEAKNFKEEAEKKLSVYNDIISSGKKDVKKILSESRQKLNQDIQMKKKEIQKEIEKETQNAELEIKKFKNQSVEKMTRISEEITSNLLKDIFGESGNESSIKATVSEVVKEHKIKKI
tara:strand:- start:963 stop:1538 length:576 start_codon:yes stop_codon:yes gene_type:complete